MPAKTEQHAHACNVQLNQIEAEIAVIFSLPDSVDNYPKVMTSLERIMVLAHRAGVLEKNALEIKLNPPGKTKSEGEGSNHV